MRAGASGLYTVDSQSGEVAEVQRWEATQAGLSLDRERRLIVQGRTSLDGTGEVTVHDRLSGETTVITDLTKTSSPNTHRPAGRN